MLIGLLSDTHICIPGGGIGFSNLWTHALPEQVKTAFRGVDLILHAGDVYSVPILDELESIAPTLASEGDDDPFEILNDRRVNRRHVINVEGTTIWLTHQRGLWCVDSGERQPDVVVFGHTHKATLEDREGILWINPGSPTFPGYKEELGSVGLLTINSGKTKAEIVKLTL